jgi:hypothetical protein
MDRAEHLQWCKDRAIEILDTGDVNQAFTSMCSDVMKHPETEHHERTNQLGMMQLMMGLLSTPDKMRAWILGYN